MPHIRSHLTVDKAQIRLCEFHFLHHLFCGLQDLTETREDAWHLAQLLPDFTPPAPPATPTSADALSPSKLKEVFHGFAQKRQPRTALLMNISTKFGDLKCSNSLEGEKEESEQYFKSIKFNGSIGRKMQEDWFNQPF